MTLNVNKPTINVREELAQVKKPTGVAGADILRAETPQQQFEMIGAGRRNIVINGAQNIFQRGSSSVTVGTTSEVFRTDRFRHEQGGVTSNNSTLVVSTDAPPGFLYSLLVTTGSSVGFSGAGFTSINYRGEGVDILGMKNGSDGGAVTLSFWVKSNKPGVYSMNFTTYNGSQERWHLKTYQIDKASSWEYKTITIPSDPSSNASSWFRLYWMLGGASSAYQGTPGQWANGNGNNRGVSDQVLLNTSGDTFQITGVQLEVGKVATPFEYRTEAEELALCQRYFQIPFSKNVSGRTDVNWQGNSLNLYSTTRAFVNFVYPVTMRTTPTLTVNNTSFDIAWDNQSRNITNISNIYADIQSVGIDFGNGGTSFVVGTSGHADVGNGCHGELSAEL